MKAKVEEKLSNSQMLSPGYASALAKVVRSRMGFFLSKGSAISRLVEVEHEIDTGEARPFKEPFQRASPLQREVLAKRPAS